MDTDIIDFQLIDSTRNNQIYGSTLQQIQKLGLNEQSSHIVNSLILLLATLIFLFIIDWLTRKVLLTVFTKAIQRTTILWDDFLLKNKTLDALSHLVPVLVAQLSLPIIFAGYPNWLSILLKGADIMLVFTFLRLINTLIKTITDILKTRKSFVDKPLDSYTQVIQIFLFFIAGTIMFSIITGSSPWSFLVSLGAASAILMLVFKDTILGFVASIQVSANDSVRVGDWIEMQKYGADGTVLQINLNNVKVQNFDKTIVTIPTHTLLTDSFKNYRGMQESGGRRIKRALNIKISSIRYLQESEIEALKSIQILAPFIAQRQQEIQTYNQEHAVDTQNLVNGRRITNIGLFRAYITEYAKRNPQIHQGHTLMVRQLAPTENGLPLELYMFTNSTVWLDYEEAMANIFDHLFAAIKYFHLEVFESPASDDIRQFIAQQR